MRSLLIAAAIAVLVVTIYSVVDAQTPEDEKLIAEYMAARGFNFSPARQTALSRIWLDDWGRFQPTIEALVTRVAKTGTPTPRTTMTPSVTLRRCRIAGASRLLPAYKPVTVTFEGGKADESLFVVVDIIDKSLFYVRNAEPMQVVEIELEQGVHVLRCGWSSSSGPYPESDMPKDYDNPLLTSERALLVGASPSKPTHTPVPTTGDRE